MNPFELVALIVAIVVIGNVLKSRRVRRHDREELVDVTPSDVRDGSETRGLRDEVQQLKQRIQVLERIVTDGGIQTAAQFEALRPPRLTAQDEIN